MMFFTLFKRFLNSYFILDQKRQSALNKCCEAVYTDPGQARGKFPCFLIVVYLRNSKGLS